MRFSTSQLSTSISLSLASCMFFGGAACSSLPDNAPKEYHLASAAIERAEDADADDVFPVTVDRAKADFKEALTLYDQSQDKGTPEPTRMAVAKAGSEKAIRAQNLAEKATDLYSQVGAWDQKIELKEEAEMSAANLQSLQNRLTMLDEQVRSRDNQNEQFQANIKSPVVFFASNQAGVSSKFQDNIDSLAMTLKSNPQLKVTLIGFADKTGSMNRNNQLAEQRAESVATALRSRGVTGDQILIDSHGASMATATAANPAGLQLDRRVDAILSNRSEAEMTTGR